MAKGPPYHGLLAEALRWTGQFVGRHGEPIARYFSNLLQVTCQGYPQNVGCDLATLMLTLPHVRKPAVVQRALRWIVGERDCQ